MSSFGHPALRTAILLPVVLMPGLSAQDPPPARPEKALVFGVERGDVTRTLRERGVVEPADVVDLACQVPARGKDLPAIRWVVEEGTAVKKGDKLLEMDASGFREQLQEQQIAGLQARAAVASAEKEAELADRTSRRDLRAAEAQKEEAEAELKAHESRQALGELEHKARELRAEGALSLTKLQAAEAKDPRRGKLMVQIADLDLELARLALTAHEKAGPLERGRLERAVERAKDDLAVVSLTAERQRTDAKAQLDVARIVLRAAEEKAAELGQAVRACVIHAPRDGLVLYATPGATRFGAGNSDLIAPGEPVREGQRLLRVARPGTYLIRIPVPESAAGLVRKDQRAQVRIDALPDPAKGTVSEVGRVALPAGRDREARVFPTVIQLEGENPCLRPGMTAEVIVTLGQRKDVLRMPVEAAVRTGDKTFCLVRGPEGVSRRDVVVGLSGDRFVEIKEGLKEGEKVVRNPRASPNLEGRR